MKQFTQKVTFIALVLIFTCCVISCKKDNNGISGGGNPPTTQGSIYWGWTDGDQGVNLSTGKFVNVRQKNWLDGFDISWDNKKILSFTDYELGSFNFDEYRVIYRNISDGALTYSNYDDGKSIYNFIFEWGDIKTTSGKISPDEKFIALDAQLFSDLPISVISVAQKEIISGFEVSGVNLNYYGRPIWTADNNLIFRIAQTLYKSSPSDNYQTAKVLTNFTGTVTNVTVNPQGTKLAFRKNKHLWLSNIDGSNMQQITNSQTLDFVDYDGETKPVFSPDGKYIAFIGATKRGTPWSDHDYPDGSWVVSVGGRYGYIIILPADGKLYDLDDKDGGAFWLKNGSSFVPCNGELIWR